MIDPEKSRPNSLNNERQSVESMENPSSMIEAKEVYVGSARDDAISVASSHADTIPPHDEENATAKPPSSPAALSRTTSVLPDAVVVERKFRRGLLGSWTLIPEITNANHYARKTKWFITLIVAFCAMAAPMGSAVVMPVLQEISRAFGASSTVANMNVAVYMLSMSIFPLWWSSFSETMGRRSIYIISFAMFTVFAILSAVSTNIAMLVVMRTLSGGAAASVQAVGAGTVADMWEPKERGKAMGLFYLGPLCGPLFAPIFGGVLGQTLGWRSTQWFLVVYGGITLSLILFALPETLPRQDPTPAAQPARNASLSRISTRQSVHQRTRAITKALRRLFLDPLFVLTWLRYPPVALTVYYASITFGSLYILNISIQATFPRAPYSFSTLIVGLLYIPASIGYVLASFFGGRWIDKIMHREARKAGRYDEHGKLMLRPEDRMKENAWAAAILWPAALICYGWTAQYGVVWPVPLAANFFFGVGSMLVFSLATTMLTEFMPKRASAGIAINNFLRNIFSFTGAVAAEPIINAIGNGWIMTILGLWSLVSGLLVIWAMGRWGPKWRVKMAKALG